MPVSAWPRAPSWSTPAAATVPTPWLAERYGCRVIGVDMVDAGFGGEGVTFVRGDLEALPFADGAVDVVWSRDTLECLEARAWLLRKQAR